MSTFETQIEKSKAEVAEAQNKIAELSARIDTARSKMSQGTDISLDIENASLDDVHAHSDLMNANIAELIMGLDDVTAGFSKDFDGLRSKTGWEKFVGIFSKQRAESLRAERVRAASIEDKLQDLIAKSNTIQSMLQEQLNELGHHKNKVEGNLQKTLVDREAAVTVLEEIKGEIQALDPNQIATQMVLLNKLSTDTKQRVVLYDALSKSLKTAQQQDVAHKINEIGVATDKEAQVAMAAIGAATNSKMAEMMEAHEDHIVFARKVLEEKVKADERFARRFEKIVEKHDANSYGEESLGTTGGPA